MARNIERDERGAIAVFTAVMISLVLIGVASLVVDIGYTRVAARDMQAVADIVAMDMARDLDGSTVLQLQTQMQSSFDDSVSRNSGSSVGTEHALAWKLGTLDPNGHFHEFTDSSQVPTAVAVTSGAKMDYFFPVYAQNGRVEKTAVAIAKSGTCFSVGSFALNLNTADSPLLSLVNGIVGADLNVLSPNGIVDLKSAKVPLLDIATELNVGSVDALLDLPGLTLGKLAIANAKVLDRRQPGTAGVALLNGLAELPVGDVPLKLGEILAMERGDDSALDLNINVLDLITGGIFAVGSSPNGDEHAVNIPGLSINVPPVGPPLLSVSASVSVIEPPKIACGNPKNKIVASNAQVKINLTGAIGPGELEKLANVSVSLDLQVGKATGTLKEVRCASSKVPGSKDVAIIDGDSALLSTNLSVSLSLIGDLVKPSITIPNATIATKNTPDLSLEYPIAPADNAPTTSIPGDITTLGLSSVTPTVKTGSKIVDFLSWLLGIDKLLGEVVQPLVGLLLTSLDETATPIVNLLTGILGIDLAGANLVGQSRPKCGSPVLRGSVS